MNRVKFAFQTTLVLVSVLLVSWPQFRPVRAATVWRYSPEAAERARVNELTPYQYSQEQRVARAGVGRASSGLESEAGRAAANRRRNIKEGAAPVFTPSQELTEAGGTVNALLGRARTSLNTPIPYARVLLRNIRTGAIEARATANEEGRYTFLDLDSSAYIVELIGSDGSVVAASEMVAVATGDVRETTVRVSANATATAAAFNDRLNSSLNETTTGNVNGNINGGDATRTASPTDVQNSSGGLN